MNESEFEAELRQLRPLAPSPELEARLATLLPAHAGLAVVPARPAAPASGRLPRGSTALSTTGWGRYLPGFGWAFTGAAAAVAAVICLQPATPRASQKTALLAATAAESFFEPETSESEVLAADEGDIVYGADQQPTQLVRYSSLEHHSWMNPATGARLEVEMPREDIFLLPPAYQ